MCSTAALVAFLLARCFADGQPLGVYAAVACAGTFVFPHGKVAYCNMPPVRRKRNKAPAKSKKGKDPAVRDIQMESERMLDEERCPREMQARAAEYELTTALPEKWPRPPFCWLVVATINSGKTTLMINAMLELRKRYYRIYYLSPQEHHEGKVRTHVLPYIHNQEWTEYNDSSFARIIDDIKDIQKRKTELYKASAHDLREKARLGDDSAYIKLIIHNAFGPVNPDGGPTAWVPAMARQAEAALAGTAKEREDRDRLMATGGRVLLIADDMTGASIVTSTGVGIRASLRTMVRMRHLGFDFMINVHSFSSIPAVLINGVMTATTVFDVHGEKEISKVVEAYPGLTKFSLMDMVDQSKMRNSHAHLNINSGVPRDYRFNINSDTWMPKQDLPPLDPPKVTPALQKAIRGGAGRRLLARIEMWDNGQDPDIERGKDWNLDALNTDCSDTEDSDEEGEDE